MLNIIKLDLIPAKVNLIGGKTEEWVFLPLPLAFNQVFVLMNDHWFTHPNPMICFDQNGLPKLMELKTDKDRQLGVSVSKKAEEDNVVQFPQNA